MRRLNDEQGGVAVFVAILLVVMFGMGALVLDVGHMYWERRQLQNGADAAALALAAQCAEGEINEQLVECATATTPVLGAEAELYADDNADADAESAVPALMTHGTDPALCDPAAGDASNPLTDGETVKVSTETVDADTGESFLSHWLAPVLGIDTSTVRACAVATTGPAMSAEGFPLAVCDKLWQANRPAADGTPGPTIDIRYKGTGNDPVENDCLDDADDNFRPGSKPGNFSWLETTGGECTTDFDFSGGSTTASGDTGANLNSDCQDDVDQMIAEIQAHKDDPTNNDLPVRILPIYETVEGSGTNATYTLVTLGAFEFSGLKTRAGQNIVVLSWTEPLCTGVDASHLCVQGRFVEEVSLSGLIDPSADSDVIAVNLVQ